MSGVVLVDVGARGGIDPRWLPFSADISVIAFEPDSTECDRLNGLDYSYDIRFMPFALGAVQGGEATLYVCKKPGCSSLLRANESFCREFAYSSNMEIVGEEKVELSRLDAVCPEQPHVIKIDTQGTELAVLEGAGALLDKVLAVEVEVEFVPQYENQALFADVDAFLRDRGFLLRGIRRTYWRNDAEHNHPFGGQLVHGDALYLRPDLIDCPQGHIILAAYRQFDMLMRLGAAELIPKRSLLQRLLARILAGYPNRELRRLVDGWRDARAADWHDPDFF